MKHLWLLVLFCAWATALPTLSHAGIDQRKLGARYNVDNSNIGFRVYSSSATRIEVYVYLITTQPKPTFNNLSGIGGVRRAT